MDSVVPKAIPDAATRSDRFLKPPVSTGGFCYRGSPQQRWAKRSALENAGSTADNTLQEITPTG